MRSLRFVMPCTWGANIIISTRTVFPLSDFMQPISGMYFKTIAISSSHPRFFFNSWFLSKWWDWCRSHVPWTIFNSPPGCIIIRELFGVRVPCSYFHVCARVKCLILLQPLAAKGSGTACMHNCAFQIGNYIHSCLAPLLRMTARKNELGKSLQSKDTASRTNFLFSQKRGKD